MTPDESAIATSPTWQGLVAAQLIRIQSDLCETLTGRSTADLRQRVRPGANPAGWLAWHLTRSHDRNLSEIAGIGQVWVAAGWCERFGRDPDPNDTGYGHTTSQVSAFDPVSAGTILDYHDDVVTMALAYLERAPATDLGRLTVSPTLRTTASVEQRLVGVLNEGFQHLGQIRQTLAQPRSRPHTGDGSPHRSRL